MQSHKGEIITGLAMLVITTLLVLIKVTGANALALRPEKTQYNPYPITDKFEHIRLTMARDAEVRASLQLELSTLHLEEFKSRLLRRDVQSVSSTTWDLKDLSSKLDVHVPQILMGIITITENDWELAFNCANSTVLVYGNRIKLTLTGTCTDLIIRGNDNWILLASPTAVTDTGSENIITLPTLPAHPVEIHGLIRNPALAI